MRRVSARFIVLFKYSCEIPTKNQAFGIDLTMFTKQTHCVQLVVLISASLFPFTLAAEPPRVALQYKAAPALNPLKGLVPYAGEYPNGFSHSMEFDYISYASLVKGYDRFDWTPLEQLLTQVSRRGHHAIFRVYLEYPGKSGSIPQFLINDGLKVTKYLDNGSPPQKNETPDYNNANLRRSLKSFITALGARYDGDNRIGYITAGLLGMWGEWHNYPRDELFASKDLQTEVLNAYLAAFRKTPVLLRYPRGASDPSGQADNSGLFMGYHDDSFAWATLETGKPDDGWFYMAMLRSAGPLALKKWVRRPIGGEIRPEVWGQVFDDFPANPQIQNFRQCVDATHVTWLMDSGMFGPEANIARRNRAEVEVSRMGYNFHVPGVTIGPSAAGKLYVQTELVNRGVAPFYYDWPMEFAAISNGMVKAVFPSVGKVFGLLPENPPRIWNDTLNVSGLPKGAYRLGIRVVNPLPGGVPLRFSNASQDQDASGWLSLGDFQIL